MAQSVHSSLLLLLALPLSGSLLASSLHAPRCASPRLMAIERKKGPNTAGAPPPADLLDEELLKIVKLENTDAEVNNLVWKYLGYRKDEASGEWDASAVFPKWAAKYPQPPDLVGVTRTYTREVDEPVLRAVQSLQRSIATEHKDNLKAFLIPLGWAGFSLKGLTPNMTRRAQCANWLLYYREALHGVPCFSRFPPPAPVLAVAPWESLTYQNTIFCVLLRELLSARRLCNFRRIFPRSLFFAGKLGRLPHPR